MVELPGISATLSEILSVFQYLSSWHWSYPRSNLDGQRCNKNTQLTMVRHSPATRPGRPNNTGGNNAYPTGNLDICYMVDICMPLEGKKQIHLFQIGRFYDDLNSNVPNTLFPKSYSSRCNNEKHIKILVLPRGFVVDW